MPVTGPASVEIAVPDSPPRVLLAAVPMTATKDPYQAYLGSLPSEDSKRTMGGALDNIARLVLGADPNDKTVTGAGKMWWTLDYEITASIRATLIDSGKAPATINKILVALRKVLEWSWRVGYMTTDEYKRATDLDKVHGSGEPAGRMVAQEEVDQLLGACNDQTTLGARDGCAIALLRAVGPRRGELIRVGLDDLDVGEWSVLLHGKGRKVRRVPVAPAARPWVLQWLAVRGRARGPLLCRMRAGGVLHKDPAGALRPLTSGQSVADLVAHRATLAGIAQVAPHDLRRTCASMLLAAGVDVVTVAKILGHASITTTQLYDRRDYNEMAAAVTTVSLPPPSGALPLPSPTDETEDK